MEGECVCGIDDRNKKWNINVKCVSSVNESNWEGSI